MFGRERRGPSQTQQDTNASLAPCLSAGPSKNATDGVTSCTTSAIGENRCRPRYVAHLPSLTGKHHRTQLCCQRTYIDQ